MAGHDDASRAQWAECASAAAACAARSRDDRGPRL